MKNHLFILMILAAGTKVYGQNWPLPVKLTACPYRAAREVVIPVTNRTGVRITKKDGNRNTFYFDTLIIQDSTITGKKNHFFGFNIKPIKLNEIQEMEVQK